MSARFFLCTLFGSAVLLAACAESTPRDQAARPDPGSGAPPDLVVECAAPLRYAASLESGTCADLVGAAGVWRASPRFPDMPAPERDSFCDYAWDGSAAPDETDRALVLALDADGSTVAPLCEEPDDVPIEESTEVIPIQGGAIGCDVCKPNGLVRGRRLYAVLPPFNAKGTSRIAHLRRADGTALWIEFVPRSLDQRTVVVRLPASEAIQEGRVSVE